MSEPRDDLIADDAAARAPRRGLWTRLAVSGLVVATVVVLGIGQYVATRSDGRTPTTNLAVRQVPTTAEPAPSTTTTTIAPTTTTTIPPLAQPAAVALPPPPGGSVRQGSQAAEIMGYEARLVELKFDPGPVDGIFDAKTRFAVEAFDKWMNWERDGVIDQAFVDALSTFQYPQPHVHWGEADRVEIDLDRQIIVVYKGWQVALVTTTSTGNGKRFCGGSDGCQYAVTPAGRYQFTWHVNGWRNGDLGRLYNPWYFNGGIAIHGYSSVPVKPASHGCARVPMHIAEYIGQFFAKDMAVYVIGEQAPQGGYPADHPNGGSVSRPPLNPAPPPPPQPPAPPETPPPPPPDTTTLPAETTTTVPPVEPAAPTTTSPPAPPPPSSDPTTTAAP